MKRDRIKFFNFAINQNDFLAEFFEEDKFISFSIHSRERVKIKYSEEQYSLENKPWIPRRREWETLEMYITDMKQDNIENIVSWINSHFSTTEEMLYSSSYKKNIKFYKTNGSQETWDLKGVYIKSFEITKNYISLYLNFEYAELSF